MDRASPRSESQALYLIASFNEVPAFRELLSVCREVKGELARVVRGNLSLKLKYLRSIDDPKRPKQELVVTGLRSEIERFQRELEAAVKNSPKISSLHMEAGDCPTTLPQETTSIKSDCVSSTESLEGAPVVLITPLNSEASPDGFEIVRLGKYPSDAKKQFKGLPEFNLQAAHDILISKLPHTFVIQHESRSFLAHIVSSEDQAGWLTEETLPAIHALQKALHTWLLAALDVSKLESVGFYRKSSFAAETKSDYGLERQLSFISYLASFNDKYQGNEGQIRMAGKLGGMHLGPLYSLASGLGLVNELEWCQIPAPYKKVKQFEAFVRNLVQSGCIGEYSGTKGKHRFAIAFGCSLNSLLPLADLFDLNLVLKWRLKRKKGQGQVSARSSLDAKLFEDGSKTLHDCVSNSDTESAEDAVLSRQIEAHIGRLIEDPNDPVALDSIAEVLGLSPSSPLFSILMKRLKANPEEILKAYCGI